MNKTADAQEFILTMSGISGASAVFAVFPRRHLKFFLEGTVKVGEIFISRLGGDRKDRGVGGEQEP